MRFQTITITAPHKRPVVIRAGFQYADHNTLYIEADSRESKNFTVLFQRKDGRHLSISPGDSTRFVPPELQWLCDTNNVAVLGERMLIE